MLRAEASLTVHANAVVESIFLCGRLEGASSRIFFKLAKKGWTHYSVIRAHMGSLTLMIWLSYRVLREIYFDCGCISGNGHVEAIKSPKETSERKKFCTEQGCEPRDHLPVCAALLLQTSCPCYDMSYGFGRQAL